MPRESGQVKSKNIGLSWPHLLLAGLWAWAIWSCAEHWLSNPNYSYGWAVPLLVVGFAFRRFLQIDLASHNGLRAAQWTSTSARTIIGVLAAVLVFALEYAREQVWHQEIVLWLICLLTVGSTIAIFRFRGGRALARAELFPVLFFLTAVPWPPRLEQPIVSNLMRWVAEATTELLHWLGVEAQTSGAAIALRTGLVGISEACSGVRSLQAGIMFGLAMGEWFLLRWTRRAILLAAAIVLALATNLIRTVALSLQAESHGVDSVDRVHDLIGNVMITALVLAIWLVGKFLAPRSRSAPQISAQQLGGRFKDFVRSFATTSASPWVQPLAIGLLVGIVGAQALETWTEAKDRTQTAPLFAAKINNSNHLRRISQEVWNELRPTKGENIHRESADLPGGAADCFHFFWKPSPWNRFALVHRPDICMPGVGWTSAGPTEPVDLTLDGHPLTCHLFRFKRGNVYALELWGVWRNGEPVPLDYAPNQILGEGAALASLHFEGKKRSATEIVACSVIANGAEPPSEIAVALLRSVFDYKGHE